MFNTNTKTKQRILCFRGGYINLRNILPQQPVALCDRRSENGRADAGSYSYELGFKG
jgi:hypothetical protein